MSGPAPPLVAAPLVCSLPLDIALTLLRDIEKLGENLSSVKKSEHSKEKRSAKKPAPVIFMAQPDPSECEGGGNYADR